MQHLRNHRRPPASHNLQSDQLFFVRVNAWLPVDPFQQQTQCNIRPRPVVHASLGQSTPGIANEAPSPSASDDNSLQKRRPKVSIVYEDTTDDVYVPAPVGKTLKINVDLMLWRCRQARLKAQLSLLEDERRTLLKEAESDLKRCLVLDPTDARTYVILGKILMMQRRYDEARVLYAEGCTQTGNTNPYIWSAWGWLEFKTGNMTRARQLYDAATVVDDTHACAWHKWGLLERYEGNYTRARDLWMQGIQRCRRKPQNQNAYLYNALAVMASQLQRTEEARAWFEEGTRTVGGAANVALWQAWACMEAKQGDASAVRYLFKKALQSNPRSRYVHLAWALWERKAGNMLACMDLLRRGMSLNPTDAALYQVRALLEWKDARNVEVARRCFDAGTRADPRHVPIWQAWGCMEAALGNLSRARDLFQQGVWAEPRSKDTVYVLHAWGSLERRQGNIQIARELFKAAIRVDPKAEKVWYTWIDMEEEAGFEQRAAELRIRQAEQQWEFEVPAGFTTRPSTTPSGAAANAVGALRDFLGQFFKARDASVQTGGNNSNKAATPVVPLTLSSPGSIRSFLPEDFEADMSFEAALQGQGDDAARNTAGADMAAIVLGSALEQISDLRVLPKPNTNLATALNGEGESYDSLDGVDRVESGGPPPGVGGIDNTSITIIPRQATQNRALRRGTPGSEDFVLQAAPKKATGLSARPVRRARQTPTPSDILEGSDAEEAQPSQQSVASPEAVVANGPSSHDDGDRIAATSTSHEHQSSSSAEQTQKQPNRRRAGVILAEAEVQNVVS